MSDEKALAAFENFNIRRVYDEKSETWFFSVVDIIAALVQQPDYQAARNYWKVLKNRLKKEGSQTVTNCNRLKLPAEDGKLRLTDVADPETEKKGGRFAGRARLELEQKTGKRVVTGENFLPPKKPLKRLGGSDNG